MINKNFKRDWKYGGEVDVFQSKHFSFGIDKDYISFSIALSFTHRLLFIAFLCLVFRVY